MSAIEIVATTDAPPDVAARWAAQMAEERRAMAQEAVENQRAAEQRAIESGAAAALYRDLAENGSGTAALALEEIQGSRLGER